MNITHNHPVRPRDNRPSQWYMAAGSGPLCFIFINAGNNRRIEKRREDGWTYEDAQTFHRWLMGWDTVTPA